MQYRKRHESQLKYWFRMNRWPLVGFILFMLILGIVGHVEYQDLIRMGQ